MIEVLKLALKALNAGEHAHLIMNTDGIKDKVRQAIAELESQEPRNVRERWNVELDGNDLLVCFNDHEKGDKCQYERYSQQRTWVGLTNEEIEQSYETTGHYQKLRLQDKFAVYALAKAIEAKLKQKNGFAEEKNT